MTALSINTPRPDDTGLVDPPLSLFVSYVHVSRLEQWLWFSRIIFKISNNNGYSSDDRLGLRDASKDPLTYLLTPCSRVLLEKLTSSQLVKKFSTFHGNQRFITPFTSDRHLFLSTASSIQSVPPQSTSWRSILILSSHLRLCLPIGLFP